MKKIIFLSMILLVSAFSFTEAKDDDTAKAASALPAVTVKDLNGQNVNFAEFAVNGQITIVSFGQPGVNLVWWSLPILIMFTKNGKRNTMYVWWLYLLMTAEPCQR